MWHNSSPKGNYVRNGMKGEEEEKVGKMSQILPRVDLLKLIKEVSSTKNKPFSQNLRWLKIPAPGQSSDCLTRITILIPYFSKSH